MRYGKGRSLIRKVLPLRLIRTTGRNGGREQVPRPVFVSVAPPASDCVAPCSAAETDSCGARQRGPVARPPRAGGWAMPLTLPPPTTAYTLKPSAATIATPAAPSSLLRSWRSRASLIRASSSSCDGRLGGASIVVLV